MTLCGSDSADSTEMFSTEDEIMSSWAFASESRHLAGSSHSLDDSCRPVKYQSSDVCASELSTELETACSVCPTHSSTTWDGTDEACTAQLTTDADGSYESCSNVSTELDNSYNSCPTNSSAACHGTDEACTAQLTTNLDGSYESCVNSPTELDSLYSLCPLPSFTMLDGVDHACTAQVATDLDDTYESCSNFRDDETNDEATSADGYSSFCSAQDSDDNLVSAMSDTDLYTSSRGYGLRGYLGNSTMHELFEERSLRGSISCPCAYLRKSPLNVISYQSPSSGKIQLSLERDANPNNEDKNLDRFDESLPVNLTGTAANNTSSMSYDNQYHIGTRVSLEKRYVLPRNETTPLGDFKNLQERFSDPGPFQRSRASSPVYYESSADAVEEFSAPSLEIECSGQRSQTAPSLPTQRHEQQSIPTASAPTATTLTVTTPTAETLQHGDMLPHQPSTSITSQDNFHAGEASPEQLLGQPQLPILGNAGDQLEGRLESRCPTSTGLHHSSTLYNCDRTSEAWVQFFGVNKHLTEHSVHKVLCAELGFPHTEDGLGESMPISNNTIPLKCSAQVIDGKVTILISNPSGSRQPSLEEGVSNEMPFPTGVKVVYVQEHSVCKPPEQPRTAEESWSPSSRAPLRGLRLPTEDLLTRNYSEPFITTLPVVSNKVPMCRAVFQPQ